MFFVFFNKPRAVGSERSFEKYSQTKMTEKHSNNFIKRPMILETGYAKHILCVNISHRHKEISKKNSTKSKFFLKTIHFNPLKLTLAVDPILYPELKWCLQYRIQRLYL